MPPSTKNFAAQAAMQEPWAVLHAKAAAGKAAPPVVQLLQHYMPSGRHRSSPMKPYSSLLQIYRRKNEISNHACYYHSINYRFVVKIGRFFCAL